MMTTEPSQLDLPTQAHPRTVEIASLLAELAAQTFTGHDVARLVEISVDGVGRAVRARVCDWAWDNLPPADLGRHITAALSQARAAAVQHLAAAPPSAAARGALGVQRSADALAALGTGLVTTTEDGKDLVGAGSGGNDTVRLWVTQHGVRAIAVDRGRASQLTPEELARTLAEAESRACSALGHQIAERSGFLPSSEGDRR